MGLTVVGILIVSLEKEGTTAVVKDEEACRRTTIETSIKDDIACNVEVIIEEESKACQTTIEVCASMSKDNHVINHRFGYLCAVTNVIFDAYGSLLTKQHGVGMTTWGINLIRFGFAGASMAILSSIMHMLDKIQKIKKQKQERQPSNTDIDITIANSDATTWYKLPSMKYKSWIKVSIGVILVTFLCPALSNYALFQIALALAITLGSVTPLYALLLEWPIKGNKPALKSCVGSIFAIAGVIILSIWK